MQCCCYYWSAPAELPAVVQPVELLVAVQPVELLVAVQPAEQQVLQLLQLYAAVPQQLFLQPHEFAQPEHRGQHYT